MAYIKQTKSEATSSLIERRNPKTIALYSTATNTVLYTVPAGRVFKGRISNYTNGGSDTIKINNTPLYRNFYYGSGTTVAGAGALQDIVLYEGDILSSGSTSTGNSILGVEYDA